MNKKGFKWLILMMVLSVLGITGIQIIWIRNAVSVLNESFDHTAYECVRQAAEAIERARETDFVNNYAFQNIEPGGKPDIWGSSYMSSSSILSFGDNVSISSTTVAQRTGKEPVIVSKDTTISMDSANIVILSTENPGTVSIESRRELATNPGRSMLRRQEYTDWLERRLSDFRNMTDQMIRELYQWEKTMEIDVRDVDLALKHSFQFSGITTPYEFAILKDGEVGEGNYKKAGKNDFLKTPYVVQLFPDNLIRQDMNLAVVFPDRNNYVLGSMTGILSSSLIFSLIILATFAFSLYFILNQKKMSEMKNDFINNMTHEFKTPIATISLAADTIVNPKIINDEYKIRQFVGMIKKENSRMNKKVETILQIASLDNREIEFRFEDVSLNHIIAKAVDSMEILVTERGGTIKAKLEAGNPYVYGDADHLHNLVNNLLDNAIKYSPEKPEVTITTSNNGSGVVVVVEDKGIGMSKSVQNKIFERFYRQTTGNVHNVKGFGLGLNYVCSIVDAHRGTITVTSEPGNGSRFEVYIPHNEENDPPLISKSRHKIDNKR
ncbi:MAG: sensor histidine kinase [Bacteroidales bacterium]|jgi:two-component system phosphate regulon sensor histidine kinase PhoR